MNEPNKIKKQKGMFTVEAVFIVPIMIICILGIIYLGILLYQNTVAVAEGTRAINRSAAYWSYIDQEDPPALTSSADAAELITKEMYLGRSPYRFIAESFITQGSQRMINSEQYAKTRVAGIPFQAYSGWNGADVQVQASYGFLSTALEITVNKKYINPLGNLLNRIGVGSRQDYTATTRAPVTSPTEFIRNVDTLYDVGMGLWDMSKGDSTTQAGGES